MYKYIKITSITIIGSFFILNNLTGQWRIPSDSIYQIIKTHSIFKNTVSWEKIDVKYENCIKAANNNEEMINCLVKTFEELNDVNSRIIYKNKIYSRSDIRNNETGSGSNLLRQQIKFEQGIIKTSLLKNKYAYIQITGNNASGEKNNRFAQSIADSIHKYNNPDTKGFIVDLRLNGEGNLESLLSGLHSLLGDGNIGGEIDENEKLLKSWNLDNGNASLKESSESLDQLPVMVLIGTETKNAGSAAAIAFKHRRNTFFIGESAIDGYTTSKSIFPINGELTLDLATAYVIDRKRHIYNHYIPTDIQIIGGDDFDNLMNDNKIKVAIRWFERKNFK